MFGSLFVMRGNYIAGTPDFPLPGVVYPSEVITSGADLSGKWNSIVGHAAGVGDRGYVYSPLTQNSNSVADASLKAAGLPNPQKDGLGQYYSPASDNALTTIDQDAFGNTTIGIYKPPGSGSSGSSTTIKHSINSQVSVYTDTNANGTPDIITIGVDANHDGLISAGETVSTGNRNQASLLDADSHIADWHAQGLIDNATYNNYTTWSTAQLVDTGNSGGAGGIGAPLVYTLPPQDNPIGAFYESVNPINDNALAISSKTPAILDAGNANARLSASQLAARDINADGRLTAGELAGLNVWTDAGEDGIKTGSEISSLSSYLAGQSLSGIAAADYGFYTQGNGRWMDAAALAAGATAPSFVQTGAPAMPAVMANGTFTAIYKMKRPLAIMMACTLLFATNVHSQSKNSASKNYIKTNNLVCESSSITVRSFCIARDLENSNPYCYKQIIKFTESSRTRNVVYEYKSEQPPFVYGIDCVKLIKSNRSKIILNSSNLGNCKDCEWKDIFTTEGKYISSTRGRPDRTSFTVRQIPTPNADYFKETTLINTLKLTTVQEKE